MVFALTAAGFLASGMAACSDASQGTGPSGDVRLAVAADLPAAASSAAAFQATDRVHVQLLRGQTEEPALDDQFPFDPTAETPSVDVRVRLEGDRESFLLLLQLLADGERIFRASESVTLERGARNSAQVQLDPVVGDIALDPDTSLVFRALFDTIQVDATPIFATGDPISNATVTWRSLDPQTLEAHDDGRLVALEEGTARAEVTAAGQLRDTVQAIIDPAPE